METVSNLTTTASKLIWGEPNKTSEGEGTISGETGDTSAGEPYDKGNEDPISTSTTDAADPTASSTTDTTTMSDAKSAPKSDLPGNTPTTQPIRSANSSDKPISSNDTTGAGSTPSVSVDPSSAAQDTTKQQGGDKPMDEPSSDEHARIAETKREAEDAAKVDTGGAGPKTLSEVKTGATEEDDGPQKESHGEGTGEKYVKSSGTKADGGNFNASNPGAGKEADRLLETKGVHHDAPASTNTTSMVDSKENEDDSDQGSPSGGKLKGLKEKIKAKLHKNKD